MLGHHRQDSETPFKWRADDCPILVVYGAYTCKSRQSRTQCDETFWIRAWLLSYSRGVFNNASARSAIECFHPSRKRSPRCLQALAIQVDRCIARKSKMVTKTIMGFREGLCTQYFQIQLSERRCMFLCVDI